VLEHATGTIGEALWAQYVDGGSGDHAHTEAVTAIVKNVTAVEGLVSGADMFIVLGSISRGWMKARSSLKGGFQGSP
jgi:hypothetical protein